MFCNLYQMSVQELLHAHCTHHKKNVCVVFCVKFDFLKYF